jgi:hypothetical protein
MNGKKIGHVNGMEPKVELNSSAGAYHTAIPFFKSRPRNITYICRRLRMIEKELPLL